MNENIKSFCIAVITVCVFVMAVIDIMNLVQQRSAVASANNMNAHAMPLPDPAAHMPKTTMHFDTTAYDFGALTEGDIVHHTFTFTNTGSQPLLISNARGSCGCTIPTYPKEPIEPGATGHVEVQFNSTGKKDLQDKTVTLTANTEPVNTILTIHAVVHAKE